MDFETLSDKKNELRVKIGGCDVHSICNLLRIELLEDSDVVNASYRKDHPLHDYAIFILQTKSKKPSTVLKAGIRSVIKKLESFEKSLKTA